MADDDEAARRDVHDGRDLGDRRRHRSYADLARPAETQQVAKASPATPAGDAALIAFLHGRAADADLPSPHDSPAAPSTDRRPPAAAGAADVPAGDADVLATLRRLLRSNRVEQRRAAARLTDLKAEERVLERLVRAAQRGG